MPAYVIVQINVTNAEGYEDYKPLAAASVAQYGGRYLVRGGESATLEGDAAPGRVAVMEFPTLEQAKRWWNSAEYQAAIPFRRRNSTATIFAVEGV